MTDREPVNIMGVIAFPEPDKSKRRIRFIDAEYNTLFYIPDGASIVITRMDGSSVIRLCTYIDDYHTLIGSEVYHICEFAEVAQRTGAVYEPLVIQSCCQRTRAAMRYIRSTTWPRWTTPLCVMSVPRENCVLPITAKPLPGCWLPT